MTTLRAVFTPNQVRNRAMYTELVDAYQNDRPVNPVVVVEYLGEYHALSGSHRVAAMIQAFGRSTELADLSQYVIVLRSEDLVLTSEASDCLQARRDGCIGYAESMMGALIECLPENAAKAMSDQL